jgi:lipid A disaccharide synthetase
MASVQILISAGEASGEMYGALLMEALQRLAGESPATTPGQKLEFFGVGGDRMLAEACRLAATWSSEGMPLPTS